MRVVSSNIKSNPLMRKGKVLSDLRDLFAFAGVLMLQEISPAYYKRALRSVFGSAQWYVKGIGTECPIVLSKRAWEVLDVHVALAHKGKATASPNRYIVVVLARRLGTNKIVAFVNTHYVSGAWNGKFKTFKKWRQRMWTNHWLLEAEIVSILVAHGITVIGSGDFNRLHSTIQKFHPDMKWLGTHGIDGSFVVHAQGGALVVFNQKDIVQDLNTDHPAVVSHVSLLAGSMDTPTRLPDLPSAA